MNNSRTKRSDYAQSEKGQVLLIVVLVSTVLLTVGLSITQLTVQESRVTKLQEDTTKARAAAEAGIEAALEQGSDIENLSGILPSDSGIQSGSATFSTEVSPNFTTPLISKDDMYTFYLTGYDPSTNTIDQSAFTDDIIFTLKEPSGTYCVGASAFALEISFIDAVNMTYLDRYIVDECSLIDGTTDEISFGDTVSTGGMSFPTQLVLLHVIAPSDNFQGTQVILNRKVAGTSTDANWPLQGQTIVSEAQTETDVSRKVSLFQTWPQLPAEFFITTF